MILDFEQLHKAIIHKFRKHGGFTVSLDGTFPDFSDKYWIVSLFGFDGLFDNMPTPHEFQQYILQRIELLQLPGFYLGGWKTDTQYYFDISICISNKAAAIMLGHAQRQNSIYHPKSGETIELNGHENDGLRIPA
jgi:hypothetical protein